MGRHAVALHGPEAVRFFYDERHVERRTALPGPVLSTLFGHGAVHTLDSQDHRVRKEMFLSLLTGAEAVTRLVERVATAWDEAVDSWPGRPSVVLFDEASRILTRGVCEWAGIPLGDAGSTAGDLVAMVDGFATPGPRHWRARRARARTEAWLERLVEDVREGSATAPAQPALDVVVRHRDADGRLLDPRTAAVELLNVVRPTVAVCWFVAYAGHALRLRPDARERLGEGDPAYAVAFAHEVRRFYPFAPFWADGPSPTFSGRANRSRPAPWSCSTCTGRTTTRTSGPSRTPSPRSASSNSRLSATHWFRRAGATAAPATADPERTSRSRCRPPSGHAWPGWSTPCPSRT